MKKKMFALFAALALTLTACGGDLPAGDAPAKDVDLASWYAGLTESLNPEEWPAQMALEGELLDAYYPGLSDIPAKFREVSTAMISAAVGELAVVEVENAEDASAVGEIFQARIDCQVGDDGNPGAAFYPDSIEQWRQTAQIVTQGNCVLLAAGDKAGDIAESFSALFA